MMHSRSTILVFAMIVARGVRQSDEKAVYWYKRAAELGVVKAQCNLGVCLINGIGCEGNAKEAVAWFRKAARRGDEKAMFNLWECYRDGEGVRKSKSLGLSWLRKAAEQGHATAERFLGKLSATATKGKHP